MTIQKSFGSDNHSGVHPLVMEALLKANQGHQPAYGGDKVTQEAGDRFREVFECDLEVYFVFTGTAANTLAIRSVCQSYEAVVATDIAHIHEDECGAPEFITGTKILTFPHHHGKLQPAAIESLRIRPDDAHRVLPKMVSITQATELGTVYTCEEIKALSAIAHQRGMILHMDGARLANAAVNLGCNLKAISWESGVDVLSFGGTKNGLMGAEALIFFDKTLAKRFAFHRKQSMQLASKMRYLSCQFLAYFQDDLWQKNAAQANAMANLLHQKFRELPGSVLPYATEANEVFVVPPKEWSEFLQRSAPAYLWQAESGLLRLVCSYDTSAEDIEDLFRRGSESGLSPR